MTNCPTFILATAAISNKLKHNFAKFYLAASSKIMYSNVWKSKQLIDIWNATD